MALNPSVVEILLPGIQGPLATFAGANHSVLAQLDYVNSGHTGFAGTAVVNDFAANQHLQAGMQVTSSINVFATAPGEGLYIDTAVGGQAHINYLSGGVSKWAIYKPLDDSFRIYAYTGSVGDTLLITPSPPYASISRGAAAYLGGSWLFNPGNNRSNASVYVMDDVSPPIRTTTPHGLFNVERSGPSSYNGADNLSAIRAYLKGFGSATQPNSLNAFAGWVDTSTGSSSATGQVAGGDFGVFYYTLGTAGTYIAGVVGHVDILVSNTASVIPQAAGFYAKAMTVSGVSSIQRAYGILLDDQTVGSIENASIRMGTAGRLSFNNDVDLRRSAAGQLSISGSLVVSGSQPSALLGGGFLGIGTVSPSNALHIVGSTFLDGQAVFDNYSVVGGAPYILMRVASGTPDSPTAILDGRNLGSLAFEGYAGGFQQQAQILAQATEDFTGSGRGTKIVFETTPVGSTSRSAIAEFRGNRIQFFKSTQVTGSLATTGLFSTEDEIQLRNNRALRFAGAGGGLDDHQIYADGSDSLIVRVADAERLSIAAAGTTLNGYLVVSGSAASHQIDVLGGNDARMRVRGTPFGTGVGYLVEDGLGGTSLFGLGGGAAIIDTSAYPMHFRPANNLALYLETTGNVGVGTTTPGADRMRVSGSARFNATGSPFGTAGDFNFRTDAGLTVKSTEDFSDGSGFQIIPPHWNLGTPARFVALSNSGYSFENGRTAGDAYASFFWKNGETPGSVLMSLINTTTPSPVIDTDLTTLDVQGHARVLHTLHVGNDMQVTGSLGLTGDLNMSAFPSNIEMQDSCVVRNSARNNFISMYDGTHGALTAFAAVGGIFLESSLTTALGNLTVGAPSASIPNPTLTLQSYFGAALRTATISVDNVSDVYSELFFRHTTGRIAFQDASGLVLESNGLGTTVFYNTYLNIPNILAFGNGLQYSAGYVAADDSLKLAYSSTPSVNTLVSFGQNEVAFKKDVLVTGSVMSTAGFAVGSAVGVSQVLNIPSGSSTIQITITGGLVTSVAII